MILIWREGDNKVNVLDMDERIRYSFSSFYSGNLVMSAVDVTTSTEILSQANFGAESFGYALADELAKQNINVSMLTNFLQEFSVE